MAKIFKNLMDTITKVFEDLSGALKEREYPATTGKKKVTIKTDLDVDFLQKKYVSGKCIIRFYDDFDSLGSDREEFNKIEKRFLQALFEQALCKHYCVVPIKKWSLFSKSIKVTKDKKDDASDDDDDDDDDNEEEEDILPPFLSIATLIYQEGNLYNYMAQWLNSNKFNSVNASVILFGIASAFKHISDNGYSYTKLSPKNIYLEKVSIKLNDDDEIEVLKPLVGDLGLIDDRDMKDPLTLRPEELSQTSDPQTIKFLVSLYLLFQQPSNDENKSIIKDFYELDPESVPEDFIFDDNVNSQIVGNPQSFLDNPELFVFDDRSNEVLEAFSKLITNQSDVKDSEEIPVKQKPINSNSESIFSSFNYVDESVNIKTINKAISSIQSFKENNKSFTQSIEHKFLIYFPLLAVAYASGDIESCPNLCNAAYYAELADYISKASLPTSVLAKFPTATFKSDAERLFYEGEVLEGNAYANSEKDLGEESEIQETVNKILTMAANKYKESAKLGFDKAKTRLAMLILNSKSSSKTTKKNAIKRLLIPAAKTDPMAMLELGMHYMKENKVDDSLKYLQKAYSNNHPDSVFLLALLHHKIAIEKFKENEEEDINEDIKNDIIENLKKSLKYYRIAAILYDNKDAASMRDKIQQFLSKNGVKC